MSAVEAIMVGYASQVAATATGAAFSYAVKKLNDQTTKGRIEIANLAISAAFEVIRRAGPEIDPKERKRLAFRIEKLKDDRDILMANKTRFYEWRRKKERSKGSQEFLKDSWVVYLDALELSESSSLKIWKDVDTHIYNKSTEDLSSIPVEEPTTPRASDTPLSNLSILPDNEPRTPRVSDTLDCGLVGGLEIDSPTPTPTAPPSPSPSTEPLFNPPASPPAIANPVWPLKNLFIEKKPNPKKSLYLELTSTRREGQS